MFDKLRKTQYIEEILGSISLVLLLALIAGSVLVVRMALKNLPSGSVVAPKDIPPGESFNIESAKDVLGK